jgi:hypothetical protein
MFGDLECADDIVFRTIIFKTDRKVICGVNIKDTSVKTVVSQEATKKTITATEIQYSCAVPESAEMRFPFR